MDKKGLLRQLPKVDEVLRQPSVAALELPQTVVTDLVRSRIDALRRQALEGQLESMPPIEDLCEQVCRAAKAAAKPSLRPVINATGVTLHTNLGRACLSERAVAAAAAAARRYSTLEYDLESGQRGSRYSHVEKLLCKITGAEAAMVVNNNAAAVLLILSAVGQGGEVITSRGELVEIGGSFRIPEIMEQCGCSLREVGATNKTHLRDYARAIGENTRALLKVHTSNYRILGFSESVSLQDMVALGRERGCRSSRIWDRAASLIWRPSVSTGSLPSWTASGPAWTSSAFRAISCWADPRPASFCAPRNGSRPSRAIRSPAPCA